MLLWLHVGIVRMTRVDHSRMLEPKVDGKDQRDGCHHNANCENDGRGRVVGANFTRIFNTVGIPGVLPDSDRAHSDDIDACQNHTNGHHGKLAIAQSLAVGLRNSKVHPWR